MFTVKEEVGVEASGLPPVVQSVPHHFDPFQFSARQGLPVDNCLSMREQQPHWSHPGPVGPQERYESEFQALPSHWPAGPSAQPKPDNRTTMTTLDSYQMQLNLLEYQNKIRTRRANNEPESEDPQPPPGAEDYAAQLRLLEEQNKTRLMKARSNPNSEYPVSGKDWTPPPGWRESLSPDYQAALKHLEEQNEARQSRAREENGPNAAMSRNLLPMPFSEDRPVATPSLPHPSEASLALNADDQMQLKLLEEYGQKRLLMARPEQMLEMARRQQAAAQDSNPLLAIYNTSPAYQMQLMLLEQQNKRRLMMARREQDAVARGHRILNRDTVAGLREQSVESNSTWSTHFTPESTPGLEVRESSIGAANQTQMPFRTAHRPDFQPSYNLTLPDQATKQHAIDSQEANLDRQAARRDFLQRLVMEEKAEAEALAERQQKEAYVEALMRQQYSQTPVTSDSKDEQSLTSPVEDDLVDSDSTWSTHFTPESTPGFEGYKASIGVGNQIQVGDPAASILQSWLPQDQYGQDGMVTKPQEKGFEQLRRQAHRQALMRQQYIQTTVASNLTAKQPLIFPVEDDLVDLEEEHEREEQVWITHGSRDKHKKPLVIRERPTCDD